MNKTVKLLLVAAAINSAAAFKVSAETVLRYAEGGPNRGTRAAAVQYFADEVARLSAGDIKIDVNWGGALLKWSGAMQGIAAGAADLGTVLSSYEPGELKALGVGDIPLEYSDPWVGMRAMYDLMTTDPELKASLEDRSLVYLSNFSTSGVQFECTQGNEIRTAGDIAGKRIRATGAYSNILDDLGANVVNMTFGKVYQALDTGLLDCAASYFYTMRAYKTYEVVETVTRVDWGQLLGFAVVMNKYSWKDLDRQQQQVLRQAGSNMIDHFAKAMIEDSLDVEAALVGGDFGRTVPVTKMAPLERQKILDATAKFRDSWIAEADADGLSGNMIWVRYLELLKEYQARRDASGYPWDNQG